MTQMDTDTQSNPSGDMPFGHQFVGERGARIRQLRSRPTLWPQKTQNPVAVDALKAPMGARNIFRSRINKFAPFVAKISKTWTSNTTHSGSSAVKLNGSCLGGLSCAFSLIEVIIAVGVFALSVVVILGMLPPLSRTAADSADALVAQSLPDSLRVDLARLATNGGFDALANRLPEMSAPLVDGLAFVAARAAQRLHSVDYLPPPGAAQVPEAARYFRVEAWRFNQPPLRYDPASAVLAVYVRVSWPYQNPGAPAVTPLSARRQLTFVVSLNR